MNLFMNEEMPDDIFYRAKIKALEEELLKLGIVNESLQQVVRRSRTYSKVWKKAAKSLYGRLVSGNK